MRATSRLPGEMSTHKTLPAPFFARSMPMIPEPVPMSRTAGCFFPLTIFIASSNVMLEIYNDRSLFVKVPAIHI